MAHPSTGRRAHPLSITPIAAACAALLWGGAASAQRRAGQRGPRPPAAWSSPASAAVSRARSRSSATPTIVEAITAEDIGKLPDVSIAESIARLPA
jgi:iron complex outermembrane receptor protein